MYTYIYIYIHTYHVYIHIYIYIYICIGPWQTGPQTSRRRPRAGVSRRSRFAASLGEFGELAVSELYQITLYEHLEFDLCLF